MYVEKYLPYVGKEGPAKRQYVSSAQIKRFALAIGESDPACFDEEYAATSEYGALIAPPTFTISLDYPPIPGLWMPADGRIHATQEFKYYKPVIADREYICATKLSDVYEKQGKSGVMVFTEFERTVYDVNMNPCVIGILTLITRGSLFEDYTGEIGRLEVKEKHTAIVDAANLKLGDELPTYQLDALTRIRIAKYAAASGDFNAIHLDDDAARKVNFDRIVAHGMFTMGMCASIINHWFGGADNCKITNYKVRFMSPAYRDETPCCSATVSRVDHENKKLGIDFSVTSSESKLLLSGSAELKYI